jgi:hypothetical protein
VTFSREKAQNTHNWEAGPGPPKGIGDAFSRLLRFFAAIALGKNSGTSEGIGEI